jgi:FtsX extracellular domain
MRRTAAIAVAALCLGLVSACSHSSTPPASVALGTQTPPDLARFLQLPVARPGTCPSNANGVTVGRASPWVGHVDVSAFLSTSATGAQVVRLGTTLRTDPLVQTTYFESSREAFEEFQRLYTCWASVPRSQVPASYRVVLVRTATLAARNALVQRLVNLPMVAKVSCDPTAPCTQITRTTTG